MAEIHRAYLSLGSNIEPRLHLPQAVRLLRENGHIEAHSSVWESKSAGYDGPNFLNCCVAFGTQLTQDRLKDELIADIESRLGRVRTENKNAPRTIDIDIILFDDVPMNLENWKYAFVLVPLAELLPERIDPISGKTAARAAALAEGHAGMVKCPELSL